VNRPEQRVRHLSGREFRLRRHIVPRVRSSWSHEAPWRGCCAGGRQGGPHESVASGIDLLSASELRGVPVVERVDRTDMRCGIVSRTDVIRCVASSEKLAA
jgi:hypothetical protein